MENQNVYLFRQKGTDYVKIGMTKNESVNERFSAFCTYSPNGGEIVGIIKTDNALALEKEIHFKFSKNRIGGEFFKLTNEECDHIVKIYNSEKTNQLITNFFAYISNEDFDNNLFLKFLKSQNQNEKKFNETELIEALDLTFKNDSNSFLTSSEIYFEFIKLNPAFSKIHITKFGIVLKNIFGKSKSKKRDKNVVRCYNVSLR
jgi:hypothetical protein